MSAPTNALVGADLYAGDDRPGNPPGHTGAMSTPRDPRADHDAETRAWAGRDDETRRVDDDQTHWFGDDRTRRVAGDADRTTAYGGPQGADPTVAYGGAPGYGAGPSYGGAPSRGADPTAAYSATGTQKGAPNHPPTVQYPATGAWTNTYGQNAPGANAYGSNSYGQNTSTYQESTAGYGQVPGSGGYGPPPNGAQSPQPTPGGGGRKTGRNVLIAVAVLVLLFLLGLLAWGLQATGGSTDSAAGQTSAPPAPVTTAPTTAPPTTTNPNLQIPLPSIELPQIPGLESLPDLGEAIGSSGVTIGSIQSMGDSSIVVNGLTGPVTVLITPQTEVLGINAAAIGDLAVGEQVVVEGSPVQNGQTTATRIVSTRFPGGGN